MSLPALRIAVAGASGRMGRMLIDAVNAAPDCSLAGTLDIGCDLRAGLTGAEVLIDFTRPEGSLAHLAVCRDLGIKAVIGTTGFNEDQKAEIAEHARHIAIVMAPNMSVGVNVVFRLLDVAGRALAGGYDVEIVEAHHRHKVDAPSGTALKMGDVVGRALAGGYDVEIVEAHHRHKVDAPSGTALKMGDVVAAAQGRALKDCAVFAREGVTGEREAGTIGFATLRGGDIVGDHTVMFCGTGERIEITHRSNSRANYAEGSLRAARFLANKTSGLFGMDDVLGLGPANATEVAA